MKPFPSKFDFADCLPPHVVHDDRFSPELLPGDRLLAVTCVSLRPRLGEFVLLRKPAARHTDLVRYIAPVTGPPPCTRSLLVWTGHGYRHVPESELCGRILSLTRQSRTLDLRVPRGWPGRDRLAVAAHFILDRLRRWLGGAAVRIRGGATDGRDCP